MSSTRTRAGMMHAPGARSAERAHDGGALRAVRDTLSSSCGRPLPVETRIGMEAHLSQFFNVARGRSQPTGELRLGSPSDALERAADDVATAPVLPGRSGSRGIDLSGVRIHTGQSASDSARALGTLAYTVGHDLVFAPGGYAPETPRGARVLAHELAHVAQLSYAPECASVVRRFTEFSREAQRTNESAGWKHPAGLALRVADDGEMAAEYKGIASKSVQRAWTTPALVAASNATLEGVGSRIRLALKSGEDELAGTSPATKQPVKLTEIRAERFDHGPLDLASDCGAACREVMGSGEQDVAVIKKPIPASNDPGLKQPASDASGTATSEKGGAVNGSRPRGVLGRIKHRLKDFVSRFSFGTPTSEETEMSPVPREEEHLTARGYYGQDETHVRSRNEDWTIELLRKEFGAGLTPEQAYAAYEKSPNKEAFDKKYGVNAYAVPRVGQGITIGTEFGMPADKKFAGKAKLGDDEKPDQKPVNFHYAAAVLSSGRDYVTLEMFHGWKPNEWSFFMYGPASKRQSFFEELGATGYFGGKRSAYVVEPSK